MTKNVVLIDDEQAMRRSVEQWLDLSDFSVRSFSNGHDALAELSADFDGVIVSDVKMPGISGMEVLDAVINIDTADPGHFNHRPRRSGNGGRSHEKIGP